MLLLLVLMFLGRPSFTGVCQGLLSQLQQQPFHDLQQLCEDTDAAHPAFSASFLFWLSAQEKQLTGRQQQVMMTQLHHDDAASP